jgi:ribulose-phosphate 3-epimerase
MKKGQLLNTLNRGKIALSASVSCLNLYNIQSDMEKINGSAIGFLHFDVVDGRFNDCFILGTPTLSAIRPHTRLPIEAHLAVYDPKKYVRQFAEAGADYISVHYEAEDKAGLLKCFRAIKECGCEPVLALRAETAVDDAIVELAREVPWILKLTVNPGYSGQKIQDEAFEKIKDLRRALTGARLNTGIQADGNVNAATIPRLVESGADILTGGTSGLFLPDADIPEAAKRLLDIAEKAARPA